MFTIDHLFQTVLAIIGTLAVPWAYRVTTRLSRIETILEVFLGPKSPPTKMVMRKVRR